MERNLDEAPHGGGGSTPSAQAIEKIPRGAGKILNHKKGLLPGQAYKQQADERRAAYEELCDEEECRKLIGWHARESARRTGERIGEFVDCFKTIVLEMLAVRDSGADGKRYSLSTVLTRKYDSDSKMKEYLPKLAKWIGEYVSDCIREHTVEFTPLYRQIVPAHTWSLSDHNVSRELLSALAEGYVRDREGLMRFLEAVFKRWRKIEQPDSLHRQRIIAQQHLGLPHVVAQYLENVGAVSKCTTAEQTFSLHSRIKQYHSRDRKKALEKRQRRGDRNGPVLG